MARQPMTLERALALADHTSPMPHDAGEALRCLREALLRVLDLSIPGVITSGRANSWPGFNFQVSADMGFCTGDTVLILPWHPDLGTPAALAQEIRDGHFPSL